MKQFTSKKKQEEADHYDDEIDFEEHFKQIKIVLFKLFTFYNKKLALVPVFFIYFLDIVEFLQTLFYITNPELGLYPQAGLIVSTFSKVLSYLNIFIIIKQNQGQNNFLLVIIVFFFFIATLALVYYSYLKIVKKEPFWELRAKRGANGGFGDGEEGSRTKLQTFLLNLCVGALILIHTVLTIPLYNILIPSFYCTPQSQFSYSFSSSPQCYDPSQILAIIMSIFSLVALITIKFCCLSLFYERNPFKNSILTCDGNMGLLIKRLIVIALLIYYIADPLHSLLPLYVGALVAVYGGYLFLFRWQKIGFYNKKYMMFTQTLQVLLLCFSLNNLIQYFIPTDTDLGLYLLQFIICSIAISYCTSAVLESLKQKLMEKYYNNPQAVKKSGQVEMFWIELINQLYHEVDQKRRRVNLKLLLKQLDLEEGSKLAQEQPQFVDKVKNILFRKQNLTINRQKLIILQYLRILSEQILQQKQTFIFSGCRCSILYQEGYKTKSLCEISKLESDKLGWMDEFFLEEIRQRNSSGTLESGDDLGSEFVQKSRSNLNVNQQLDEQKIVVYQQYISLISLLQVKINTCLTANVQFWNQLLQEKPDFVYSMKLAKKILYYHQQILTYHKNIQSVFTNSIKTKLLFYSYLQTLQWSQTHTQDILEFLQQNQYNLQERNSQKLIFNNLNTENFHITFGENQKIVMIELDIANYQGYIKNVNSQVFNFLGYTKNQLIGRRIDKLLPSPIAAKHAQFVQNFMNRKESISRSSERIVFAVHKNKFLVPGFLTIKVIYNQQKGMKLIAFIRPLYHEPRTFGILSHSDDTIVVGVTKQIAMKVRDREFIAEMSNESVYMELLFPNLKYDQMLPNKTYQTEMATFNNLQQEFMQQKNVKVSVRYQQSNYQQNLNLRYYFVTYEKVQMNIVNMLQAKSLNFHNLQTRLDIPDLLTMNTHNVIDNFKTQREDEKKGKMEQLCIFKQNYLNKYNNSKYLVCMLMFLAVFAGVVAISVMVYSMGAQFQQSVLWTKQRIIQLSLLAKDVSVLETHWIAIYQINNDTALSLAKQQYQQLSDEFQQNMQTFKSFQTVSDELSLFNLKIIPQAQVGQNQRLREILDFQATSLIFQDLELVSSMEASELQWVQLTRDELLNETGNILQIYIGNELDNNLQMEGFYDSIQQTKFYYSMGVIGVQVGFLILTYLGLYYMKEYVQKNMELIHYLSYYQIRNITQSINDFIKSNLSSQLQSYEPSILTDSQKPSSSNFPMSLKFTNSQISNDKKVTLGDQNSLYQFFKQDDNNEHKKNINKKPIEKIKFQPEKKIQITDQNKFKLPPKPKKDNKLQNQKLTQDINEFVKNVENKRTGTAISNVSIHYRLVNKNKKDQQNNKNRKLSGDKNDNNPSIENNTNRLAMENSGNKMNQRAKNRGLNQNNRRQSFGKESQVMQLSSSSMQLSEEQSIKSLKRIAEKTNNQKKENSQQRLKELGQQFSRQNEQEIRRKEHKLSTLQQATIEMEYPSRVWWMLICVVVIGVFVGAKELLYTVQGSGEGQMMAYGESMNHLVKLDNQLMYLRSFILPYFMNMTDLSFNSIITNQSLFSYVLTVQQYTSVIYTDFFSNQEVLMNIQRDITLYMYLLQRYSPDSKYLSNLASQAPAQLLEGINRILDDFLLLHDKLMSEIAIIDSNISQNSQLVKVYYIMEISITIVLSLIILIIQYYLLIWNLKVDEEATFRMIQFIPLQTINSNKNLFRTIQKHSTKE